MNRLFIIGNGFDLAHGLSTSYSNFIDDFWSNLEGKQDTEEYKNIVSINETNKSFITKIDFNNFDEFVLGLEKVSGEYGSNYNKNDYSCKMISSNSYLFKFKNDFFKNLNKIKSIRNWVDIENEYYKKVKEIINSDLIRKQGNMKAMIKLNKEFDQVKILLENYLDEKVNSRYDFERDTNIDYNWVQFYNILRPISKFNNEHNLFNEFLDESDLENLRILFEEELAGKTPTNRSYLLNFNYTKTLIKYVEVLRKENFNIEFNFIHGEVKHLKNVINFGFGDEMDEDYKMIENLNENEYLKNFKSFQYLQNSNYNELLKYVNSEKFQVIILGHSCGLSDRTLLNTIFEHKNCRSIKIFYHEKDRKDNFTDVIQNISRHFDNKKIMREKIVNKSLCSPLPQIQLPKIEI